MSSRTSLSIQPIGLCLVEVKDDVPTDPIFHWMNRNHHEGMHAMFDMLQATPYITHFEHIYTTTSSYASQVGTPFGTIMVTAPYVLDGSNGLTRRFREYNYHVCVVEYIDLRGLLGLAILQPHYRWPNVRATFLLNYNWYVSFIHHRKMLVAKATRGQSVGTVIMFHGTTRAGAQNIRQHGFSAAMNKRAAYGAGTYFTTNIAEARRYAVQDRTGRGCIFVCALTVFNPSQAQPTVPPDPFGPGGKFDEPPLHNPNHVRTRVQNDYYWFIEIGNNALPILQLEL